MDNVGDIRNPLVTENESNPQFESVFLLQPTLINLTRLQPAIDIKEEPYDIEDYRHVNPTDVSLKVEEAQVTPIKIESESNAIEHYLQEPQITYLKTKVQPSPIEPYSPLDPIHSTVKVEEAQISVFKKMDNIGEIRNPLVTENESNPQFQTVFLLEPTLINLIPLQPALDIKEEPYDIEDYRHIDPTDVSLKIEEAQVTPIKIEPESNAIEHYLQEPQTTYLKTEVQSSPIEPYSQLDPIHTTVKVEEAQITVFKSEVDSISEEQPVKKFLFCRECQQEFEGFCPQCPMLLQVFDHVVEKGTANRAPLTLPKRILMFDVNGGIVTMKGIPSGVTFGPYEGLESAMMTSGKYGFKVISGKFLCSKVRANTNWLQFVKYRQTFREANLVIIQCKGQLYYRSCRQIKECEELLVYFDKMLTESYYEPAMIAKLQQVFTCINCGIGFSTSTYLQWHWKLCPRLRTIEEILTENSEEPSLHSSPPLVPLANKSIPEYPVGTPMTSFECKMYNCETCKEDFPSWKTFLKHIIDKHDFNNVAKIREAKSLPAQCQTCNKVFPSRKQLVKHKYIHTKPPKPPKR